MKEKNVSRKRLIKQHERDKNFILLFFYLYVGIYVSVNVCSSGYPGRRDDGIRFSGVGTVNLLA